MVENIDNARGERVNRLAKRPIAINISDGIQFAKIRDMQRNGEGLLAGMSGKSLRPVSLEALMYQASAPSMR
jgi:hypothetical protein